MYFQYRSPILTLVSSDNECLQQFLTPYFFDEDNIDCWRQKFWNLFISWLGEIDKLKYSMKLFFLIFHVNEKNVVFKYGTPVICLKYTGDVWAKKCRNSSCYARWCVPSLTPTFLSSSEIHALCVHIPKHL